jgi:outer membrane receptor for ferric coprogen and ferric-rhodotorulic acid
MKSSTSKKYYLVTKKNRIYLAHNHLVPILSLSFLLSPFAVAQDQNAEPPIIYVEGDAYVVTEDSNSYTTTIATVGSKQPVEIKKIPQTINVITNQRMQDAAVNSIEEAAYLSPNISTATGDGYSGSIYSRGYEVLTYNIDGAPRPYLSLYGTAPDLVFFDRLEVLSGPSGVFQGTGEPVGTVNLVRKRPKNKNSAQAAITYGSYGQQRIEADVSGALNESGTVRGRIIGFGATEDSFVDYAGRDRSGVSGTLEFDIGEATILSVGGIIENNDINSHSGLPTYSDGSLLDVDDSTFFAAPWNSNEQETKEAFVEVEHEFDDGAIFKFSARGYQRNSDIKNALSTSSVDLTSGDFDMMTFARNFEETTQYLDANYTSPFLLDGIDSEFTIGADLRNTDQEFEQNFDFSIPTQNINSFDASALVELDVTFPGVGPGFRLNTTTESKEKGVYGYTRLGITEKLNLSFGGRYTWYKSVSKDLGRETTTADLDEKKFVPSVGVSFDFAPNVTAYTSYTEIFQPQNGNLASGARIDPLEGRQVEVGVKSSLFDKRINTQASVYWLRDKNRAIDDPDNAEAVIAADTATTRGFELSASGSPIHGLDISAGYTYADSDLDTDPTSKHNLSLWGKYSFQQGALKGAYAGFGVRHASSFNTTEGTTSIKASGYTVADALVGYKINNNVDLQLNVNNVFDKNYITRINDTTRGTFYGEPRSASLKLSVGF